MGREPLENQAKANFSGQDAWPLVVNGAEVRPHTRWPYAPEHNSPQRAAQVLQRIRQVLTDAGKLRPSPQQGRSKVIH